MNPEAVIHRFQTTVRRNRLWGPDDRLLVGISGGPDSVALAALARETGLQVGLAHVNYGLRGADSEADEALVRELAAVWGIPLEVSRPDIRVLAVEQGASIQQAARTWRYAWWEFLLREKGFTRILTGHQADDQVETLLLYLMRGGPRAGFQTIPYRRGPVCRPLLDLRREDLLTFLDARSLPWRQDHSNLAADYRRNAIRLELLPAWERISPGVGERLARLALRQDALLAAAEQTLEGQRPRFLERSPERLVLDLARLQREPWCLAALFDWLRPMGFHHTQIQAMHELDPDTTGQRFEATDWVLVHDRGTLRGEPRREGPMIPVSIGTPADLAETPWGQLEVSGPMGLPDTWPDPAEEIVVDAGRINWPLTLRPWAPGDRFTPLGMAGRKKIKDLLIDRKRDHFRKARTLVLCDAEGTIIWVVGEQMAGGVQVGPATQQVYRMRWLST